MKLTRSRLAILVIGFTAVFPGQVTQKAWLFAIVPGAMGYPRKAITLRQDWPVKGANIFRVSLEISVNTRETIHFHNYTCGVPQQISAQRRPMIWRFIFRHCLLKRPMMDIGRWKRKERRSINSECQMRTLLLVLFVTAQTLRVLVKFLVWEDWRTHT